MKHYKIIEFSKTLNGREYPYILSQTQGSYNCPQLNNDVKIESDFCCEPDSKIKTIQCIRNRRTYMLGQQTYLGIVQEIKLKNGNGIVRVDNNAWVAIHENTLLTPVNNTTMKTEIASPSRSQIDKNDVFKTVLAQIDREPDLRLLNFYKKELSLTVKEFLINFFTKYNNKYTTVVVSTKAHQCDISRRRSLGDLYKICKYYYPDVTLYEVIELLYRDLQIHFKTGFRYSYCSTVKKMVFYYQEGGNNYAENYVDEYGHRPEYYTSKL